MIRYNPQGPSFVIYPTDDPKVFAVWRMKDHRNGYEAMVGSKKQCADYIQKHLPDLHETL